MAFGRYTCSAGILLALLTITLVCEAQKPDSRPDPPKTFITFYKDKRNVSRTHTINQGGTAYLECTAITNPKPEYHWTLRDGSPLPSTARLSQSQRRLELRNVLERTCVLCTAIGRLGNSTARQCIDIFANCTNSEGESIRHGSGSRSFQPAPANAQPSPADDTSACIILIVDEAHTSMSVYHEWLRRTQLTRLMEVRLVQKSIGVFRRNRFCLLTLDSHRHNGGRLWQVGEKGSCGSSEELTRAFAKLSTGGRWDDAYSAIKLGLHTLPCAKQPNTAAQVLLFTNQERPQIEDAMSSNGLHQTLATHSAILNSFVHYPFPALANSRAIGVKSDGRPILPVRSRRFNNATLSSTVKFRQQIEIDFINPARRSGGAAFDLEMVRAESNRDLNATVVTELTDQIVGQLVSGCRQCVCDNGAMKCHDVRATIRQNCLRPTETPAIRVSLVPSRVSVAKGGLARLECIAHGDPPLTLVWSPQPLKAVAENNTLIILNVHKEDVGKVTCMASNAQGYSKASSVLSLKTSCPNPGSPSRGYLEPHLIHYHIGMAVRIYCEYGYARVGYRTLRCTPNGEWSLPLPQCRPVSCGKPPIPANGKIRGRNFSYQQRVRYLCKKGYSLDGPDQRWCTALGYWSGYSPRCNKVVCADPEIPSGGSTEFNRSDFGAYVYYTCSVGLTLLGSRVRRCQQNGLWSGAQPECVDFSGVQQLQAALSVKGSALTLDNYLEIITTRGLKGERGDAGQPGRPGSPGEPGEPGRPGEPGAPGVQGPAGPAGPAGVKGEAGSSTESVVTDQGQVVSGRQGARGEKGEKGAPGRPGTTGRNGVNGERGRDGVKGEKGERGERGRDGQSGTKGVKGEEGVAPTINITALMGEKGERGDSGLNGADGTPGVKGEKGDKGEVGDQGVVGPKGRDGLDGPQGEKGGRGDQGARGSKGDRGPRGEAGPQGEVGETGLTGQNGQRGPQGEKGDAGQTGYPGEAGTKGEKGAMGPGGSAGPKGEAGDTGSPGLAGRIGNPGRPGLQGEPGPRGPPGEKGEPGLTILQKVTLATVGRCSKAEEGTMYYESTVRTVVFCDGLRWTCVHEDRCREGSLSSQPAIPDAHTPSTQAGETEQPSTPPPACVDPGSLLNGEIFGQSFTVGSTVTWQCSVGYQLVGRERSQCTDQLEWQPPKPSCTEIFCPQREAPTNGIVQLPGVTFDSVAVFRCMSGYELQGVARQRCQADGTWSDSVPTCTRKLVTCSDPGTVSDATRLPATGESFQPGAVLTYSCLRGHTLSGSASLSCGQDGRWNTSNPRCSVVNCGDPGTPANGRKELVEFNNRAQFSFGKEVEFTCLERYRLSSSTPLRCLETGRWSAALPSCHLITCGDPGSLENGNRTGNSFEVEQVITFRCNAGFRLVGSTATRCEESGQWSRPLPSCQLIGCPPPTLPEGSDPTAALKREYTFDDRVTFRCRNGYDRFGGATVSCLSTGQWTTLPQCRPKDCPDPGTPDFGQRNSSSFTHSTTVGFSCQDGYDLAGAAAIRCSLGQWNGSRPSCQIRTCPVLTSPTNGRMSSRNEMRTVGSVAQFDCFVGYALQGSVTLRCLESGKWSEPQPTCNVIRCPNPGSPEDGLRRGDTFTANTTISFECQQGFYLIGDKNITCQPAGSWSGATPTCSESAVGCRFPPPLQNGERRVESNATGGKVHFSCLFGYRLSGAEESECQPSGRWSPPPPTCEQIFCSDPGDLENGRRISNTLTPGSTVLNFCNSGFTLTGSQQLDCQLTGEWLGEIPKCVPDSCPDPGMPENGQRHGDSLSIGAEVTFSCSSRWRLAGNTVLRCMPSGAWNGSLPTCVLKPTSAPVLESYSSCTDAFEKGRRENGVYSLQNGSLVRCDQSLDGGRWTVIQQRADGSENFDRTWADYERGFGSVNGSEFWLGLDRIYQMVSQTQHELYIELTDFGNEMNFARYTSFSISAASDQYRLTVSGFSGPAGNPIEVPFMPSHQGSPFFTKDRDNMETCAKLNGGGWWYHEQCQWANLNGVYKLLDEIDPYGIIWLQWRGIFTPLKGSRMLIRPFVAPA